MCEELLGVTTNGELLPLDLELREAGVREGVKLYASEAGVTEKRVEGGLLDA